jgi:hypothetical protein
MRPEPLFSAALNKGQALLSETHQLASHWHPDVTTRTLIDEARTTGYLGRATENRIQDLVRVFSRRYMHGQPPAAAHLHQLARQLPVTGLFAEICLIHTAAAHPELDSFIREVYWPAYYASQRDLSKDAARDFFAAAQQQGRIQGEWSEGLLVRTARRLTGTLTEFGLLGAPSGPGVRPIRPFQPRAETLVYLVYWLREHGLDMPELLAHPHWQLLGLKPAEVLPTLRRLALHNWFTVLTAGDLLRLEWHYPTTAALLDDLTQRRVHATA